MGQTTSGRGTRSTQPPHDDRELTRLKLELVAARERGEAGALARVLMSHPHYVAELSQFAVSLAATSGYDAVTLTAESEAIAERARTRALAALFPAAAPVHAHVTGGLAARVVASLKALRRARGLSLPAAARRLGLGLDVVQNLEAGLIRAASVPERLTQALSDLLDVTAEQVHAALDAQLVVRPALQRGRSSTGTDGAEASEMDFTEAVRLSPAMTAEQKSEWLGG